MSSYARVVVEIALNREFDYIIPEALRDAVAVGSQVVVPFGKSEVRGFVVALPERSDRNDLREIIRLVGKKPLISGRVMELARWVAEYYAAPVETAVRTVLPSAVRQKNARFKEQLFVIPMDAASDAEAVRRLRARSPRQAAVLDILLSGEAMFLSHLAKTAGTTAGTVRGLEKKGFVRISREAMARDPLAGQTVLRTQHQKLMPQQEEAFALIRRAMDTLAPPVVLLYGVTGSGKTEVYLQAIDHALKQGKGAIILVPEISLTPQTVERFQSRFGDDIAVLHSHLSGGERHDEWHRLHSGKARIAIGARSALFAPIENLGLIVVDEEHEHSYKQGEAPRYHARDVAVMRGHMERCAVVLGTATPSLESWHNAQTGKYALARMPYRVDHRRMPHVRVIDMRLEAAKTGRVTMFSSDLVEAVRSRLARAEQVILFLNRRGHSTSLICPRCGYVATCKSCSVPLTYHKVTEELRCHICGAIESVPRRCPNEECRDPRIRYAGIGTQKVELAVAKLFPKANIQRMDADVTTKKDAYSRILGDFRVGKTDILIGTQMIAKGLHFPNVTLVGVIAADVALHMPDFRAGERTFQLLTQVAGRAGRGDVSGEVIVQTFTPFHPSIQTSSRIDFEGFADQEMEFRKELFYPPYSHLICITVRGRVEEQVKFSIDALAKALFPMLPEKVVKGDPAPAPLARTCGQYRWQIMLRAASTRTITGPLRKVLDQFRWPKEVHCTVDVDALSLM